MPKTTTLRTQPLTESERITRIETDLAKLAELVADLKAEIEDRREE